MKRAAFLHCVGIGAPRFKLLKQRDQLPFAPDSAYYFPDSDGKHADYTLSDAFLLRVFLDATENKGLSIEAAKYIAGNCMWHLRTTADAMPAQTADLWIFYAQGHVQQLDDSGEFWTPRHLGAGRLEDLAQFVNEKLPAAETQFITLINATMASARVLAAAFERGVIIPDDEPVKHLWARDYQTVDTEIGG